MRSLLDVNVLLALLDEGHVAHNRCWDWAEGHLELGWATCAITQNAFVRIISQPRYPRTVTPYGAVALMRSAIDDEAHEFWTCDASLLDQTAIDHSQLLGSRQVTDVYLLALATARQGQLVTLDRSIPLSAVRGSEAEQLVVL